LEHDDLLEMFRYDEERGLSRIVLEQGTEIEIPIEDEQGVTFWIAGEVSICHEGCLKFRAEFPGSTPDTGIWKQTRSRADMDVTWRLPPALRKRQPAVNMILNTQGYTPWHHPQSGSHWLRLQSRGAWTYGDHVEMDAEQNRVYGWRIALSTTKMGFRRPGRQDFTMSSAIENHMTNEDLGPEASKQDWTTLKPFENSSDGGRKRYIPWATQQKRETDGLRYPPGSKTGRNYNQDIEAGLGREQKKQYPASMLAPELGYSRRTNGSQNTREWTS